MGAQKKKAPMHHTEDSKESKIHDAPDWSIQGGVELGPSPRTGLSGGEPGATDWSVRGNGENTTKRRPGLEHLGRSGARPKPPDWIVRGRTQCHGLEHPRQRREYDKKTPRIGASRGGIKHGTSPRTGSPGGEPGATDSSITGNGENTIKRRPGLEYAGRNEARH